MQIKNLILLTSFLASSFFVMQGSYRKAMLVRSEKPTNTEALSFPQTIKILYSISPIQFLEKDKKSEEIFNNQKLDLENTFKDSKNIGGFYVFKDASTIPSDDDLIRFIRSETDEQNTPENIQILRFNEYKQLKEAQSQAEAQASNSKDINAELKDLTIGTVTVKIPTIQFLSPFLLEQISTYYPTLALYSAYWLIKSLLPKELIKFADQTIKKSESEEEDDDDDESSPGTNANDHSIFDIYVKSNLTKPFNDYLIPAKNYIENELDEDEALKYIQHKRTNLPFLRDHTLLTQLNNLLDPDEDQSLTNEDILKYSLLGINNQIQAVSLIATLKNLKENGNLNQVICITNSLSDDIEPFFHDLGYKYVQQEGPSSSQLFNNWRVPETLSWYQKLWYALRGYIMVKDLTSGLNLYFKPIDIKQFFTPQPFWKYHKGKIAAGLGLAGLISLGAYYRLKNRR